MAKRNRQSVKESRQSRKQGKGRTINHKWQDEVKTPVQAKTEAQKEFLAALNKYDVVLFSAPAGVGKSFLTMSVVSDWLKKGVIDKITLTRPVIPMGRSLGMLPNDLRSKYEPHLLPLLSVLWERYGKSYYENCLANGSIHLLAAEYARGMSVDGVMIIDEVQNFYPDELYTLLTRMNEGSKLVLLGDATQNDIAGKNAIEWLKEFSENNPELGEHIKVVTATSDDIVRSGLCRKVVQAKERECSFSEYEQTKVNKYD